MSYYATGHSMTGYYGDPSFWGAVKGAVGGFITGGWGGAVVGAVAGSHGTGSSAVASSAPQMQAPTMPGGSFPGQVGYAVGRVVRGHPVLTGAAAAGTIAAVGAEAGHLLTGPGGAIAGARARGYHMSKPYKCHGTVIPSHPVRNRHMNVCNPRALRRASRRAHGFLRVAHRLIRYYTPRKHKGKAYIHARKRAR